MTHPSPIDAPFDAAEGSARRLAELTGVERHDVAVVLGSGWKPAADRMGEVAHAFIVPAAVRVWVWPTSWTEWLILLGIGATTQSAQVLMTRGLHLLPVSRATAVSYVQVVFGFVIGAVEFREVPTAASMAGAALILAGMAISAGTGTGRAASG